MFENLLQLAADDDKATLEQMAKKYPALKNKFELGEKLEPLQDRLKTLQYDGAPELAIKELEDWRGFKQTAWPEWQQKLTATETAYADAQTKIAELESTRGTDVTSDEIKQIVKDALKEQGFVSNTELESKMTDFVNKTVGPTLDTKINGLTLRFEDVFDKIEATRDQYRADFPGEIAPRPKAVFDYMKEHKLNDPETAFKAMTGEKYQAKTTAQIEADKKAEREAGMKEGRAAAIKELGSKSTGPVDGRGGSVGPRGALMRRAMAKMPKDADGTVDQSKIPLGKGVSKVAVQEYYDKQAAGAAQ